MKKVAAFIVCLVCAIQCGCTRVTELDEKSFVTAIGFDKGKNYNLRFTFIFTTPTKSSDSSNPEEKDETIIIEAPSLYSAIEQINNFKSKTIELTHTQTIVFSEELARDGLEEYIYMLVRSSHFRPNTYICVADNSSMEFLENVNPSGVYHLEKFFQLLFNKMTSGTKGDMYLYDSYFRLNSESRAGVLPYCAINKTLLQTINSEEKSSSDEEETSENNEDGEIIDGAFSSDTDDFAINTLAGNSVSISENTSQIQGVAVMKDGFMIAKLGRLETLCLQVVTNSMPEGYFTLSNPYESEKMISCYITQPHNVKIDVDCEENPKISIDIRLEGDFTGVGESDSVIRNPKEFEAYFEQKLTEAIEKFLTKTTRELDSDICSFETFAKSKFSNTAEWEEYNWNEKFKNSTYDVNVELTMRTYGELSQETEIIYD